MGRPRKGAKAHAGNFSERKQTNMFSHCPQEVHACTWIIDSTDHESFVIMSWYGSTKNVPGQNKG